MENKILINDDDVEYGFKRCACDTKYNVRNLLVVHSMVANGCRVCGKKFVRLTDQEILQALNDISPNLATLYRGCMKK